MKNVKPILLTAAATCMLTACSQHTEKPEKPNIIFIFADDLGYADIGCYGQEKIKTPNLDKMASEGIRFTDFYSGNTVSAPSRCALMTGKHMGHAYIRGNTHIPIRTSDIVLSEIMKSQGYATGMFGKWGLGNIGTTGDPSIKGWDAFTGYTDQTEAHFYYKKFIDKIVDGKTQAVKIDTTEYTYSIAMNDAKKFIKENKDKPFFAYIPIRIPHSEYIVPEEDLKPYLDENGNSIFEEIPYEGGEFYPYDKPYAAYAGMITKLDKDIGSIIQLLKDLEIDDNTLVFFTSDNGGTPGYSGEQHKFFSSNGDLKGIKRDLYEGGIRVPMIAWCPGIIPAGEESDFIWALWDIAPTFSEFAGTSFPETDGISVCDLLLGNEQKETHDYIYHEYGVPWLMKYIQTVRKENWKLVKSNRSILDITYELYNLEFDIGEERNLAEENPEKVKELEALMNEAYEKSVLDEFDYSYLPTAEIIPSDQLFTIDGKEGGLTSEFYSGMEFNKFIKKDLDPTIHHAWDKSSPAGLPGDEFSIRWSGKILINETGTYTFYTAADDGVRLFIDNKLVLEDWNSHGVEIHSGKIELEAGKQYDIKFEYFENVGGAEVRLSWITP